MCWNLCIPGDILGGVCNTPVVVCSCISCDNVPLYLKLYYILNITVTVTELFKFSDFPYLLPIFTAKHEIIQKFT